MGILNVNTSVRDEFYRYKMPSFSIKIEGKKTIILNLKEVSKAIDRSPLLILKYFGSKLGSQSTFDAKNNKFFLRGVHSSTKLQDLLNSFIQKYVLCAQCSNPETRCGSKGLKCRACGFINKNLNSKYCHESI